MAVTVDAKCAADTEINSVVGTTGFTSTNLTVGEAATALFACLVFDGSANLTTVTVPRRLGHRQIRRLTLTPRLYGSTTRHEGRYPICGNSIYQQRGDYDECNGDNHSPYDVRIAP